MNIDVNKGPACKGCDRLTAPRCAKSNLVLSTRSDVLFVGDQPDSVSAKAKMPLYGPGGKIIKAAVHDLRHDPSKDYALFNCGYTYAAQCVSLDDSAPSMKVLNQCQSLLYSTIAMHKPKVIVALGATAMKQLGFKQKHTQLRGKIVKHPQNNIPTLISFAEKALLANPGLYQSFKLDIKNAFDVALRDGVTEQASLEALAEEYLLPVTVDDALAACEEILACPTDSVISVDTETNTLHPQKEDSVILSFCFAWGKRKATTILCDHPHVDEEYKRRLPEVWAAIRRVLESPHPKSFHNAKFDLKFIELRYGIKVNAVAWDTLLGEHLLDEDKKGNYGLKALTAAYLPKYCGYEDKLHDILNSHESISMVDTIGQEIDNVRSALQDEYPEYLTELKAYQKTYTAYEKVAQTAEEVQRVYELALQDYDFQKSHLAGLVAVWKLKCEYHVGRKNKPKRPTRWFSKPAKPRMPKKPKRPKDPRSKKEKQISQDAGFENVPIRDLQLYGAVDADVTRQLTILQKIRIVQEQSKVIQLMRTHAIPASRTLGRMEYDGTRVDQNYIEVLEDALSKVVKDTEVELYGMTGRKAPDGSDLNLNHPATLANVLFNWGWTHPTAGYMGAYDATERTKGGQYSTAEKALRAFVAYKDVQKNDPTDESYFIERLLRYRKASKAHGTFLANVRALSRRDGFLHTQFHLNGTGTGRLSSSDMNMQNIPKYLAGWNIKKLFIPDSDEYFIANVDYKGAEVRVFTAYARDAGLITALNDGMDMHCFFASKVFNRPYEMYAGRDDPSIVPDAALRKQLDGERSDIKRVVFGILYGAGRNKISETIGVTPERAQELIDLLYAMFPAIRQYAVEVERQIEAQGFVETFMGRRRRFPIANFRSQKGRAVRQGRNFKIQSTSSDIVLAQMIEMDEPLRRDFGGRMLLTVHDSMVMQFPRKYGSQLKDFVKEKAERRVSEKYPWLPVPFTVDIEAGPNYGECQNIDKYLIANPFVPVMEGIVEEQELLNELKDNAFEAA